MAPKLVLAVLTEFLISKVLTSYMPYSSSPYAIRDPRFPSPYNSYYASYASNPIQPTYQRPAEVLTPAPRPYLQPSYSRTAQFSSPGVPRPVEFRPNYPAPVATPTIQPPIEYRLASYQKAAESVSPVQTQRPIGYRMASYQKPAEYATPAVRPGYQQVPGYVTPRIQPMELPVAYQKTSELLTPIIQSAMESQLPMYQTTELVSPVVQTVDFHQPAYEKIAEFIANQKPIEIQHTTSDLITSNFQSSQIPKSTSSSLESLLALALGKSDCLTPKPNSGALDADVLNNLAIALQLLIVSNIINHPRSESIDSLSNLSDSLLDIAYSKELSVANPFNVQTPCEMPNAKFLGSSGDDNMMSKSILGLGTGLPLARPGFTLMSPYDAIAASSPPFSDSSQSLYALKNNFQSPYAAIMAADSNRDLFSTSDLFLI